MRLPFFCQDFEAALLELERIEFGVLEVEAQLDGPVLQFVQI